MKFAVIAVALSTVLACSLAQAQAPKAPARAAAAAPAATKGQVVKIMWIDPLTGLMGPVGTNQLKSVQFLADKWNANNPAGVKFEVHGTDNKLSPAESLNALKAAIDQGVRYILQGNGSSVAEASRREKAGNHRPGWSRRNFRSASRQTSARRTSWLGSSPQASLAANTHMNSNSKLMWSRRSPASGATSRPKAR